MELVDYLGVLMFLVAAVLFVSVTPCRVVSGSTQPVHDGKVHTLRMWGGSGRLFRIQFNIRFYVFALAFLIF